MNIQSIVAFLMLFMGGGSQEDTNSLSIHSHVKQREFNPPNSQKDSLSVEIKPTRSLLVLLFTFYLLKTVFLKFGFHFS